MSRFPSSAPSPHGGGHVPGQQRIRRQHHSGKTRKGSKWLRKAFVEAAHATARSKSTYLAAQYHRIKGPRGPKKAAAAVVISPARLR